MLLCTLNCFTVHVHTGHTYVISCSNAHVSKTKQKEPFFKKKIKLALCRLIVLLHLL